LISKVNRESLQSQTLLESPTKSGQQTAYGRRPISPHHRNGAAGFAAAVDNLIDLVNGNGHVDQRRGTELPENNLC